VSDKIRKSGFLIELPEPSPEKKALTEYYQTYDRDGDLIDRDKYDYSTLASDPPQYRKIKKITEEDRILRENYKRRTSPMLKRGEKNYKHNPFARKTGGKAFGPPPESGPQPQGMKDGNLIGCPHRENGVKSDIKGIKDIQLTGTKFIGVK